MRIQQSRFPHSLTLRLGALLVSAGCLFLFGAELQAARGDIHVSAYVGNSMKNDIRSMWSATGRYNRRMSCKASGHAVVAYGTDYHLNQIRQWVGRGWQVWITVRYPDGRRVKMCRLR